MPSKVLIVEDDPDIVDILSYNLKQADLKVTSVPDGSSALAEVKRRLPDLILLDLMLPKVDGLEVCRLLKGEPETKNVPIIMITAKGEEVDRIVGLELGADDYIIKPFSPREVVLRVRSVLKRSVANSQKEITAQIEANGVIIDIDRRQVNYKGKPINLTATEFDLLLILAKTPGRVFTRNLLMDLVWGQDYYGVDRTVDTHMSRLRQKLGGGGKNLQTVHGIGYRFKE
ncbi:DNA-binding response regulator [Candidatus Poribacteria bacterium]|nr:DNA-binding response regulator [Candidatus Poribacteria bacterium]